MASLLYRLGRTAYRRWPIFIAAWVIILVGFGSLAVGVSKPMVDKFSIPGIPSLQAQSMQQELFPGTKDLQDQATATVVVQAPKGHTLSEAKYKTAVDNLITQLDKAPQMPTKPAQQPVNPVIAAAAQQKQMLAAAGRSAPEQAQARKNAQALSPLSKDGRTGTLTWNFDVKTLADVKSSTQDKVLDDLKQARRDGIRAEVNGTGMQAKVESGGSSELLGVIIAAIVLFITFGSLVAAGMPIISAAVGVAMGELAIQITTAFTTIGTTTPVLATMIGLAVGIDYTLFILARYRTELDETDDRSHAAGMAVGKAGSAVVFAGLTVLIALCALSVVRIPFLTSMGLAAAGSVFFAVCVALTLLPAVLGLLKSKVFGGQLRKRQDKVLPNGKTINNGVRWAHLLGKKPAAFVALVVVVLGALAVPMMSMHLALPTDTTAAKSTTQRQAADMVTEAFGAGRQASLLAVVDATHVKGTDQRMAAYGQVMSWAGQQKDVVNAQIIGLNKDKSGAQLVITPRGSADDQSTVHLLDKLRSTQSAIEQKTGTTVGVTGTTALETDVSDRLSSALPIYLLVVVGLAFVLLIVVFRSLVVPLMATLGFLLSVLATLGATVGIFQNGFLGLVDGQPIVSFMPIIIIGIVFGLAMDYQVFLVTRMREAYVHGDTAREAVVDGFRHGSRVVTAAATIMISVFGAFIFQSNSLIQSMGFALAVAVFFDAFVVRMTFIPAVMYLLGDKAWWLPKWLDKVVPKVDIEGEGLAKKFAEEEDRRRADEDPALVAT